MAHIGTFGRKVDATIGQADKEKVKLDTVGVGVDESGHTLATVRVKPATDVPMFPMTEFARLVTTPNADKHFASQSVIYGLFEANVYPEDWPIFRSAMVSVDPQGIIDMAFALYGRWSTVPFDQLQDSSDGDTTTSAQSTDSSSPSSQDSVPPDFSETNPDYKRLEAIVSGVGNGSSTATDA